MNITLRIQRYNPEIDTAPYFKEYSIYVEPTDRVLDVLMWIKYRIDGTLAVRKSCAHGICGSDAMIIDGKERLACKTIIQDIAEDGATITIEPLHAMKVQRDLMVDQTEFFAKYRSVKPYFVPKAPRPEKEYIQLPQDHGTFEDPTKCILCGACFSACPVMTETNQNFVGPAALVQAARFVFDNRDKGIQERLESLDHKDGAWACESKFECTKVCPRGIKVTKGINEIKRAITALKGASHETA